MVISHSEVDLDISEAHQRLVLLEHTVVVMKDIDWELKLLALDVAFLVAGYQRNNDRFSKFVSQLFVNFMLQ